MNENEQYVADHIRQWVWSGFFTQSDIEQFIDGIAEEDCDTEELRSLVGPALRTKLRAERSWPQPTDCDRLDEVFFALHSAGVCALANTGTTMSDGFDDVAEVVKAAPDGHYRGFCFYHGQDIARAIDGQGLMLAFGDIKNDAEQHVQIGQAIAEALRVAGFAVEWNGTVNTRIKLPAFDWKRRAAIEKIPTTEFMLGQWYAH
jgi:hypothetical protein